MALDSDVPQWGHSITSRPFTRVRFGKRPCSHKKGAAPALPQRWADMRKGFMASAQPHLRVGRPAGFTWPVDIFQATMLLAASLLLSIPRPHQLGTTPRPLTFLRLPVTEPRVDR